jgi:hypothetical protein
MSIWGTFFSIEDERQVAAELEAQGIGYGLIDDEGHHGPDDLDHLPEEMTDAPIIYQASHVLPSGRDERGGYVMLSSVGGFVCREDRESEQPHEDALWPFLRLEAGGKDGADAPVVLTLRQAERLRAALDEWVGLASRDTREKIT